MLDILAASIEAVPPDVPILFGLGATQLAGIAAAIGVGIASFLGLRKGGEAQKLAPPEPAHAAISGMFFDPRMSERIAVGVERIGDILAEWKKVEREEREDDLKDALRDLVH